MTIFDPKTHRSSGALSYVGCTQYRATEGPHSQSVSMTGMPRSIVMDVDTGTDDALAILYALGHPDLEVLGISCVAGNVAVDQVVINTCKVLDAAGAGDIPVVAGAVQPLIERARREGGSHGPDGLAGIQLPDPRDIHRPRMPSSCIG